MLLSSLNQRLKKSTIWSYYSIQSIHISNFDCLGTTIKKQESSLVAAVVSGGDVSSWQINEEDTDMDTDTQSPQPSTKQIKSIRNEHLLVSCGDYVVVAIERGRNTSNTSRMRKEQASFSELANESSNTNYSGEDECSLIVGTGAGDSSSPADASPSEVFCAQVKSIWTDANNCGT